jgi:hypothetical protein
MPSSWIGQLVLRAGIMVLVCGVVIGSAWYVSTAAQPKQGGPNKPAVKPSAPPQSSFASTETGGSDEKKAEGRREKKEKKRTREKDRRKEKGRWREGGERERGRERRDFEGREGGR